MSDEDPPPLKSTSGTPDELVRAVAIYERLIARGVLAAGLGEAREAEISRELIAECDRALAAG